MKLLIATVALCFTLQGCAPIPVMPSPAADKPSDSYWVKMRKHEQRANRNQALFFNGLIWVAVALTARNVMETEEALRDND